MKYKKIELLNYSNPYYDKEYVDNYNKEAEFQNERFETLGIPPFSIKLEIGKKYSGSADGEWEILTINNELWFCSDWCCVDFNEIKDEK